MVVTLKVNKFGFLTEAFALWGEKGGFLGEGGGGEEERDQFCAFFIPEAKFSTQRERERPLCLLLFSIVLI